MIKTYHPWVYVILTTINLGGMTMVIDLTKRASEELKKILESKKINKPLRIYIAGYGWGGPTFGIALDEHKEGDIETKVDGFVFLTDEMLQENFQKFTIDYNDSWIRKGFTVIPDGYNYGNC